MKSLSTILIIVCVFTSHAKADPPTRKSAGHALQNAAIKQDKRKPGSPLDHLPAKVEILTHFGERADFSPDNQEIAFMSKSFGDAMVFNLKNR